jgi:uncharacterized protein
MKSTTIKKMKIKSNWVRLLLYFIFWIGCCILFFIPIFIYFPASYSGSRNDYTWLLENSLTFLIGTQIATVLGALLAIYLMVNKIEKRRFSDINLTLNRNGILRGFLLGASIIISFVLIMQITGLAHFYYSTISSKIALGFFLYSIVAVGEEIVVRGYILNNLREKMNDYVAVIISSLFFGAMHFFNDHFSILGFLNISIGGILLGILLIKTNSISAPIGLHWAWNFIQGPIAGFNVSGHKEMGVLHVEPLSPTYLTGGDFGAEGSILLIPIVLIFIYFVLRPISFSKFFKKPV